MATMRVRAMAPCIVSLNFLVALFALKRRHQGFTGKHVTGGIITLRVAEVIY